jgi:hypothetical protein
MAPFVVAAFHDRAAAEHAIDQLRSSGIAVRDARLHATTSDAINAAALVTDELASGGFFTSGKALFEQLLGTQRSADEAVDYEELVRREATLVTVHVDSAEAAAEVAALLGSEGALRVSRLPQRGLEG